ncbi:FUSC family protein [Convivina intestini]|uniref:FUSC family protein n=1 Tax=Convivina intestini TaxID=1505726 RepID=UPI00200FD3D5|nr:FUSC family protein [Convivina intestini]CAH1856605.1 hypothetical protein R078131_01441 [Convivina intestini]
MFQFTKRNYLHAFYGLLTLLAPLVAGTILNNNWLGVMGCFGALLFMYYVPVNRDNTLNQLLVVNLCAWISFPLSALASRVEWVSMLWIAGLAFFLQLIMSANRFIGPGVFFLLMINGMLASLHSMPLNTVCLLAVYAIFGAIFATLLALIENGQYEHYSLSWPKIKVTNTDLPANLRALIIGLFAFLAYFIGYHLHLNNYYWLLVSALTILQSENVMTAKKRQLEYIGAGLIGTVLAFVIYSWVDAIFLLALLALLFMALICLFMPKSYLIGNFFTTPIALILFKIVRPGLGNDLIVTRILAILLGTMIGLIGVWYYDWLISKLEN